MDQYSREFIAEKARLRPEDLGLVRTARRSHNQLWPGVPDRLHPAHGAGAPGQQPFEILEDLVGYVATELNANPRDLDLYARRGLLKGEQLHALARCVHYGRLDQRDFERQTGAASCLLLILAAIIYWQIREIDRVLSEAGSDADDLNFELLSHISPIGWDNVLLYGASTSSTAVSCEAKGLAYKFARFWALP